MVTATWKLLLCLFLSTWTAVAAERVCHVADFGAVGDGSEYDTSSLQAAIDTCQGGGRVVVHSGGRFLTATLYLRSNLILEIEKNATIYGGSVITDFPWSRDRWYTILGERVTNVTIMGEGTINGQAQKFVVEYKPEKNLMVSWNETAQCLGDECRPRLLGFIESTNIKILGIHLHEPAYWCLHIVRCRHTQISNISIFGDFNIPNNDGIDIDGSNHTRIEKVKIDTGDDAICPKSTAGAIFDLSVTDSWLRTKSSAVKLGSGSEHDFQDLHFERLVIEDSHRGLGLQLRDEGSIANVTFKNIQISTRYYDPSWWGRAEPVYITACPRTPNTIVGSIRDVFFYNISAVSENGIFLAGSPNSKLEGIVFKKVSLKLSRWTKFEEGKHDYRPGCQGLVEHETSGIFLEHVSNLKMEEIDLIWGLGNEGDLKWRMPMEMSPSTVKTVQLNGFAWSVLDSVFISRKNKVYNETGDLGNIVVL